MNILLVEPEINGHHFAMYVRFLVRGMVNKNYNFSILTSKKIKNHAVLDILKNETKNIKFYYLDELRYPKKKNFFSLLTFQIANFRIIKNAFNEVIKKENFDHIFLTTIDHIDKVIPFMGSPFGKYNFSSIILNPKNHFNYFKISNLQLKTILYNYFTYKILKLSNLKNLYSNDIFFVKYINKFFPKQKKKLIFFEEPVELKNLINKNRAKSKLKLNKSDFIVLVYGAIKSSKSIKELTEIIKKKEIDKKIRLLVCGEQTIDIKNFFKKKEYKNLILQKKIILFNKFLNLKDEALFFSAADLIWIAYKNSSKGSSGILYLAKKAKTPIITSNEGIPFLLNKKFNLGPSVDIGNRAEIVKVLNEMSKKKVFYSKYELSISKFGKKKYVEKFYLKILSNLKFFR